MIELPIQYGQETEIISIPEERFAGVVRPIVNDKSPRISIQSAIRNPLDGFPLESFLSGCKKLLIIVNDATRPTPTGRVLDCLLPGIRSVDHEFLIATGSHSAATQSDLLQIFGRYLDDDLSPIRSHDCKSDDTVLYGKTSFGTEVRLNGAVDRASHVLVIGSVEPHYFAGFTGGRKSFLPGIAANKSIRQNHSLAMSDDPQPMRLSGNPVHEDMVEAMAFLREKPIYSIQTVLDETHRVVAAFPGGLESTFDSAVETCRDYYGVPVREKVDIVVAVARPPLDRDLYQSQKAMEHARLVLNPGGVMILVSACPQGIGPDAFFTTLSGVNLKKSGQKMHKQYHLGDHKAARWISLVRSVKLYGVTQLPKDAARPLHLRSFRTVRKAVDKALAKRDGKILVIPDATTTVPVIAG